MSVIAWSGPVEGPVLVLISGWGTDGRIFLDIPSEYRVGGVSGYDPDTVGRDILEELSEFRGRDVVVMGVSMGGYVALEAFCQGLYRMRCRVILIGMRPMYPESEIRYMMGRVNRVGAKGVLASFYEAVFGVGAHPLLGAEGSFSEEELKRGLAYLATANLEALCDREMCGGGKVVLVHGRLDRIAPLGELEVFCNSLFLADASLEVPLIVEEGGHLLGAGVSVSRVLKSVEMVVKS